MEEKEPSSRFDRPAGHKYKKVDGDSERNLGEDDDEIKESKLKKAGKLTGRVAALPVTAPISAVKAVHSKRKVKNGDDESSRNVTMSKQDSSASDDSAKKSGSTMKKVGHVAALPVTAPISAVKGVLPSSKKKVDDEGEDEEPELQPESESKPKEEEVPDETTTLLEEEEEEKEDVKVEQNFMTVTLGPALSVLLHDATLLVGALVLVAMVPTFWNLAAIRANMIPSSVAGAWIIVAFAAGYEVAVWQYAPAEEEEVEVEEVVEEVAVTKKKGYSVLSRVSRRASVKIQFKEEKALEAWPSTIWSVLGGGSKIKKWQRDCSTQVSDTMMKKLLENPSYRTKKKADGRTVIDPIIPLRGVDVFLTDIADQDMANHPFLIENGLRDKPSCVVNLMTQWANICIYFELPEWLKYWDNIPEDENDPDDVKALKLFLKGDDEYKTQRLSFALNIKEGPMPVKVLCPPKTVKVVHFSTLASFLPYTWSQHDGVTRSGRYLHPCIELEMDCVSNKWTRGVGSLLKRYLKSVTVDLSAMIDPHGDDAAELSSCLATWKFKRIDVPSCSEMPKRISKESSLHNDTIRASVLMQKKIDVTKLELDLDDIEEEDETDE